MDVTETEEAKPHTFSPVVATGPIIAAGTGSEACAGMMRGKAQF